MKQGTFQRRMTVAACLALLLLIGMPLISRMGMGSNRPCEAPTGAMVAGMAMPDGTCMRMEEPQHTARAGRSAPDRQTPLDACGYCSLFNHLPYVMTVAACLALLPRLPTPVQARASVPAMPGPVAPAFRPRGPPQVLDSLPA